MQYSCIITLAIWVYNYKDVVFEDISNPDTSISKIIDFLRPIDEWADIAFLGRQNVENDNCETLNERVRKLKFEH